MVLVLLGCALSAVAAVVPVMRWSVNEAHEIAGDARIWYGEGWTLADAGFQGASLLPFANAAIVPLAIVAVGGRGHAAWWWVLLVLSVAVVYVPVWTAVAFARKWEDDVGIDVGGGVLVAASGALAAGLWLDRPWRSSRRPDAPDRRPETATDLP